MPPESMAPPEPRREPSLLVGSVGFGMGVPYGVFGGAVTLGFDYLALIAGVGTTVVAGAGYGVGARIYLVHSGHEFRPHLTAVWGTTATYQNGTYPAWPSVVTGVGFYAGLDHDFGEAGGWYATYGLGYITHLSESPPGTPIDAMFGLGYRFGGR
jgi:hypothetical protein